MIRQAWLDIVKTINRDKALYGIGLKPLHLDPLMPEPIVINDDMAGYHVRKTALSIKSWHLISGGFGNVEYHYPWC